MFLAIVLPGRRLFYWSEFFTEILFPAKAPLQFSRAGFRQRPRLHQDNIARRHFTDLDYAAANGPAQLIQEAAPRTSATTTIDSLRRALSTPKAITFPARTPSIIPTARSMSSGYIFLPEMIITSLIRPQMTSSGSPPSGPFAK